MDAELDPQASQPNHRKRGAGSRAGIKNHDEATKAMALSIYAETGSTSTAAQTTGLPLSTVHSWVNADPDIDAKLESFRRAVRERVAHIYADIAHESAQQLLDRVQNGDEVLDKEGNLVRRKVPARELAFITSVATDKHALLTGVMGRQSKAEQALTVLANKLIEAGRTARERDITPAAVQHEEGRNSGD